MKFKHKNKGRITQGFNDNYNSSYAEKGYSGHTGVDSMLGYGSLIEIDNPGYIYKVWYPQEREDNWCALYQLVPMGDDLFMEVCIGHCSSLFVKPGDTVLEGEFVGREGNFGKVFSQMTEITPAMQDAGDKRGSHRHESYRPVRRVKKALWNKRYLENKNGRFIDKDGYVYEVINENNVAGCVDPRQYDYVDTRADRLRCTMNALLKLNRILT